MRKILSFSLLTLVLVLGGAGPPSSDASAFKTLFCPQCWEYLWGAGSLDMKGNCAECGKYPVELDVRPFSWWWCSEAKQWKESACERAGERACCTRKESLAAVVPAGPGVTKAWYCPAHDAFKVVSLPIVKVMMCSACGRPAVRVPAVERSWYWCANEGQWSEVECSMNPVRACCARSAGMLFAAPDAGPIAR